MGTGFLMGIDIFHGYGFGMAKPSGFVPVAISSCMPWLILSSSHHACLVQ
jgi:cytochrome c biogenesis factor